MEEEEDNLKSINRRPRSTHPPGFPIVLSSFIIIISISSSIICITTMTIIMIYMHWCLWWCQEGFADSPNIDSATRGLLTKPAKEKGIDQARKGEGRSYQGTLTRQALNYRPEVQKLKAGSHLLKIIEEHFKSIWQSMRCFLKWPLIVHLLTSVYWSSFEKANLMKDYRQNCFQTLYCNWFRGIHFQYSYEQGFFHRPWICFQCILSTCFRNDAGTYI